MQQEDILTIGILAHVDAGKTTLSECLLHKAGAIKSKGSVDKGSTVSDKLSIEKSRGISIKSATVDIKWNERPVNIVDTPGHIDFSAEVDRVMNVLDLIILVVSAKEGVQAHTLNLWGSITERSLPVLIFINKIDRDGADPEQVFFEIEQELNTKLFALNLPDLSQADYPQLIEFSQADKEITSPVIEKSLENLADIDETFLEDYLNGEIGDLENILKIAQSHIQQQNLNGVLFGSAKLDMGTELLLDNISNIYQATNVLKTTQAAKVFKVEFDPKLGRLIYIRSYGSDIKTKDVIWSQKLKDDIKINQIFKLKPGKYEQRDSLKFGEIGVLSTSAQILTGDVLGKEEFSDDFTVLGQTVFSVEVKAAEDKDYQKLGEALEILNIEDPQLDFKCSPHVQDPLCFI